MRQTSLGWRGEQLASSFHLLLHEPSRIKALLGRTERCHLFIKKVGTEAEASLLPLLGLPEAETVLQEGARRKRGRKDKRLTKPLLVAELTGTGPSLCMACALEYPSHVGVHRIFLS